MYLQKIEELSRFLAVRDSSKTDICKFLNFDLFSYLQCRALYFAQLSSDGSLYPDCHYGFKKDAVDNWGSFPLTFDMPITAAVKRNTCIAVNSPEQMYKAFPSMKSLKDLDHDWETIIAIPVHAYGVYSITTFQKVEVDADHERFLRTIGQLVTFAFSKCDLLDQSKKKFAGNSLKSSREEMSPRQQMIHKLILKGFTNGQIGEEIGFSESLVRQETMAIYSILKVSGRKELLEKQG